MQVLSKKMPLNLKRENSETRVVEKKKQHKQIKGQVTTGGEKQGGSQIDQIFL